MIDQVKIAVLKQGSNFGEVVVEPLPQGFGVTLGNALRRVLLTSLPGMAVTSVKIDGVAHEYSTIQGVKEDVVQILLNLKKIRLQPQTVEGGSQIKAKLSEKGVKVVTAGDLEITGGARVTNPDQLIAALTSSKAKLELDLTAEGGVGYLPVEDRKSAGIGVIPLDAVFSPVIRVNYKVEATRVGQITNFDKLTLQVLTDGTILPEDAVRKAAKILSDYFDLLQGEYGAQRNKKEPRRVAPTVKISKEDQVEELELPTRVMNSLKSAGIETVGDLLGTPQDKILSLKNLGAKSFGIINERLEEKGLVKAKNE